ncbi:MAG: tryptophan--tRNA ligase [Planctomycetota bacterium]|jgi:tryptophanyl-tRNA synthetase
MRVLSGVQPSGKLHLGNYLGAIKQHIALQHDHEGLYFIANYHSLTTVQDAPRLRELTRDVAVDYLALGLEPNKACLFRQSDVPEVCELAWILSTVTGEGLMRRAHSYKDKVAKGISPTMGLMSYPLLMAADILIYDSDIVPVGQDQVQHLEMTQDIAGYLNHAYQSEVLKRPEVRLNEACEVPGIDGQKMSKSYGNTIELFDTPAATRKRIMGIQTDCKTVDEPKDPEGDNLYAIYRLLATAEEVEALNDRYLGGGMGYGDLKKMLAEVFERTFGPARERRAKLAADTDRLEDILADGAKRARAIAQPVMERVRKACGIATAGGTHD